ncbi:gluconate 2-dehydrogenase subunit 3 family protein [Algoriphagus aquimarinus]|uniref:Gluconate 2-dehydrogenase subunit 3 family protein n=1 Tax=Algoriphagus aquimarinus TaxID=237018 RepID=A0A5C7APD2_9BACT|nr:gluconate 2-dehydrogenase subunit 3 family protein [Algoriphagus aquimarinus]TXE10217.1 gluconate 2-dehydrogenase subunit 3 family protein [Algoriphagus aquimarinus]
MERREALKLTASLLGGSVIGSPLFLSGCSTPKESSTLLWDTDLPLLDEIGETILPDTEQSPGAKAGHIGEFMKAMVNDCYDQEEAEIFIKGLKTIDKEADTAYGKGFLDLSEPQRLALLSKFDRDAKKNQLGNKPHFFTMMKELSIWGYFTSEPGATKALRYNPIPGRFEGCIPYNGENAWA